MRNQSNVPRTVGAAAACAMAMLAAHGCSREPSPETAQSTAASTGTTTTPISQLPLIDGASNTQLLGELLRQPTPLGETTALHIRLPPPRNPQLASSLVRVVGSADHPQILFRSDALAQLGVIGKSPGPDFFTAFSTLSPAEFDRMKKNRDDIASGAYGKTTTQSVVFTGKRVIGRAFNPEGSASAFLAHQPEPVNRCPLHPVSTTALWGKVLFITDPAVVQDPARTWDPCSGAGTPGGSWTFAHLMREMATGSGTSPEDFVTQWLSLWLNDYAVNNDVVSARTEMFTQVIQPWAVASGATATLVTDPGNHRRVQLTGPLDLDIAPFRLVAIVNRIDLATPSAATGYYGSTSSGTPGELRFIFTVVQPNPWGGGSDATCGKKRFTVILEYGVPGTGCDAIVNWAQEWTGLQTLGGFSNAYLNQLEAMTESVVVHGGASGKGNDSALDQIRTNEAALGDVREMREFQLGDEISPIGTTPSSGLLRAHTVAQTPNDGAFAADGTDPAINQFIDTPTCDVPSVPYLVPPMWPRANQPFLAGNALIGPGHWSSGLVTPVSPPTKICARHQFSLNTCGGCHHDDTATTAPPGSGLDSSHVDALGTIPVALSSFLTGGGPGLTFNVPDSQLGAPMWGFAELERRLQNLFDLSHCKTCGTFIDLSGALVTAMALEGPVAVDPPDPSQQLPFEVGPITDLGAVQQLLQLRTQFASGSRQLPIDFIQPLDAAPE